MSGCGVSIVICTYNGRGRLGQTFSHIIKLQTSYPWELILVDNASTDGTGDWASHWLHSQETQINFQIVFESRPGLNHARMMGVEMSSYDYILFCDDDNWLSPNFLSIGVDALEQNSKIGVLGSLGSPRFEVTEPRWFNKYSHSYAVGTLGKKSGKQKFGSYHYGAACFFRKEALIQLLSLGFQSLLADRKGETLSSGGDVELGLAVQLLRYELHFDERLKFDHFIETHRLDWYYYLKLKKGISQSYPLLESYKVYEFKNLRSFKHHLLTSYFIVVKGVIKSGVKKLFLSTKSNEVAWITTRSKLSSFFKNYSKTLEAFQKNKKMYSA